MFQVGLEKHEKHQFEIADFQASVEEAKLSNRQLADVKLTAFNDDKNKVWS